jgi:hypothetical protein
MADIFIAVTAKERKKRIPGLNPGSAIVAQGLPAGQKEQA